MMKAMGTANAEDALEMDTLCEALGRDRSHVLVLAVAPRASTAGMPALLAERLASSLEVASVSLAGLDADPALVQILAERGAPTDASPESRLLQLVEELSQRGSALVLALPDATSIPGPTLERLGRLATRSGQGLRLALFVDCDLAAAETAAAELVSELGVGLEKIALGLPAVESTLVRAPGSSGGAIAASRSPTAGPPRVQADPSRRKPHSPAIRVRRPGGRRGARRLLWAALVVLAALPVVWWSAIGGGSVRSRESASTPPPVGAPLAKPLATLPPTIAELAANPPPLATGLGRAQLHRKPPPAPSTAVPATLAPAPPPKPVSPAPAVVRVREIPVSMNARPWARIEVDGRSLGTTPLGDVPLTLGSHEIRVRFPDGRIVEETVEVDSLTRHFHFP